MWCASSRRRHQLPHDSISIAGVNIAPVSSIRCLGVVLDSCLLLKDHSARTTATCFGILRQIRSIRRSVPRRVLTKLIVSLVHSRLYYCSSFLAGSSDSLLRPFQSVLNSCARLIFNIRLSEHVSPTLKELRWLPVKQRVLLRLVTIVHRCLSGRAPPYLISLLSRTSDLTSRRRLRSSSSNKLAVPRTKRRTFGDRSFPVAVS